MSTIALKQEIHQALDDLPPDVLPELAVFLDFLRFKVWREMPNRQVREAASLYTTGEVSLGRAAELAGMNYFLFEEWLRKQGISALEPEATDEARQQEIADEILA